MYNKGSSDGAASAKYISNYELAVAAVLCTSAHSGEPIKPSAPRADTFDTMVCLSFSSSSCQGAHPTALDYFLAVLVMVTAVVAARLLASAVARCLCGDGDGPDAHHHHHHDHHHPSPDPTTDVDGDVVELPWGGAGLAIFGQDVPPPPPRRNDQGWHWHGMMATPVAAGTTERVGHVAHPSPPRLGC